MRAPTKQEVLDYIEVVNSMRCAPKTETGLLRVVAKFFHCKSNDIKQILEVA
jgi:hypothetical protein